MLYSYFERFNFFPELFVSEEKWRTDVAALSPCSQFQQSPRSSEVLSHYLSIYVTFRMTFFPLICVILYFVSFFLPVYFFFQSPMILEFTRVMGVSHFLTSLVFQFLLRNRQRRICKLLFGASCHKFLNSYSACPFVNVCRIPSGTVEWSKYIEQEVQCVGGLKYWSPSNDNILSLQPSMGCDYITCFALSRSLRLRQYPFVL